jgi:hypothetical protein
MVSRDRTNEFTEVSSEQRSGEVQYESFLTDIPDSIQKIEVTLGYRRSTDFDKGDNPGQDFATVRSGEGYVVGVVADGVSQSFYGDLAARYLSRWLTNRLWQERETAPSASRLETELKALEREFATEVVEKVQIPEHLAPMLRQSLEDTRGQGSQAVFAAFVLDARENRLHLYQVGDADALVHYPDKPPTLIQAQSKGRWSSAGKSKLQLRKGLYEGASGVVIRSDGAGKDWGESLEENALSRGAFEVLAQRRAGIDDISFVAARWDEVQEKPLGTEIETVRPPEPVLTSPREEPIPLLPRRDGENHDADLPRPQGQGREVRLPPPRRRRTQSRNPLVRIGVAVFLLIILIGFFLSLVRNHTPEASKDRVTINEDTAQLIRLSAKDVDNDSLTYKITSLPSDGNLYKGDSTAAAEQITSADLPFTLPASGNQVTYQPIADYNGSDSFKFRANDDKGGIDTAKVSVKVTHSPGFFERVLPKPLDWHF